MQKQIILNLFKRSLKGTTEVFVIYMAPGPKKRNFKNANGKVADSQQDTRKKPESNTESQNINKIASNLDQVKNDTILNDNSKYSKRTIEKNWSKYDEPIVDPHADTMRGKDFEVLLSYSGGGDSQLRLQDEKEWEDNCIEEKSITFDLKDLENAVKCIPFHKRLNLPTDIFNGAQLEKFVLVAEEQKQAFESKLEFPATVTVQEKAFNASEPVDPHSNIIESYESEEICDAPEKPFMLEEKTESIIESLASCLSLKNSVDKLPEKQPDKLPNNDENADDLDFLLSLSTATSKNIVKDDKPKEKKLTNVDDWLNSLLDD